MQPENEWQNNCGKYQFISCMLYFNNYQVSEYGHLALDPPVSRLGVRASFQCDERLCVATLAQRAFGTGPAEVEDVE
jgi:hypothetical protein